MIREYSNLYHPKGVNTDVLKLLKQQKTILEDTQKKIAQQHKELKDKIAFFWKNPIIILSYVKKKINTE